MFAFVSHLNTALQTVVLALLAVGAGYGITYLRSSTIGKKIANATSALEKRLSLLVGQKTLAEAEAVLETSVAAEVAKLTGLTRAEVLVIGEAILHDLFPHPAPAPATLAQQVADRLAATLRLRTFGIGDYGMTFQSAYSYLKHGHRIKLPEWGGYWSWDAAKKTVVMHTRTGEDIDMRASDDMDYTLGFTFRTDWMLADGAADAPAPAPAPASTPGAVPVPDPAPAQ